MELNKILLNNIMYLIEFHGLKETQCLKECGVHNNFLSNLKRGILKKPSFEHIYAIAKYFNVTIEALVLEETAEEYEEMRKAKLDKCDAKVLFNGYEALDDEGKEIILRTIKRERTRMINEKKFVEK